MHRAIAAGAALAAAGASALAAAAVVHRVTATIHVTLTDEGVALSPESMVAGSAVFRVSNTGRRARDFEIAGKRTPVLAAGQKATLRSTLPARPYRYVSVGQGRAARFTGYLGVLPGCPEPTALTVDVSFLPGYHLILSRTTVPCGTVTFHVTNDDPGSVHDFNLALPTLATGEVFGPKLKPGRSVTMTVDLPYKGQVYYLDEEPEQAENGDAGFLRVR